MTDANNLRRFMNLMEAIAIDHSEEADDATWLWRPYTDGRGVQNTSVKGPFGNMEEAYRVGKEQDAHGMFANSQLNAKEQQVLKVLIEEQVDEDDGWFLANFAADADDMSTSIALEELGYGDWETFEGEYEDVEEAVDQVMQNELPNLSNLSSIAIPLQSAVARPADSDEEDDMPLGS